MRCAARREAAAPCRPTPSVDAVVYSGAGAPGPRLCGNRRTSLRYWASRCISTLRLRRDSVELLLPGDSAMRTQASAIADMRQRLLSTDKVGKLYKVKDVVGLGSQATVSVAVHRKTGGQVAVKIYDVSCRY